MPNDELPASDHSMRDMSSRRFLFLQGPASPFLRILAKALEKKGASVRKISVCIGDVVFWWPRWGDFYRGKAVDWPVYLDGYISDHNVTDLVMLGDGRALHAAAAELGIERGINVHILEHGYLRPDWLTIEPDGMTAHSRFPNQPAALQSFAAGQPPVVKGGLFDSSFLTYAVYDLTFHIPNVLLGWLLHPHYRAHGSVHPVLEYGGWVWKGLTARRRKAQADKAIAASLTPGLDGKPHFFLFPLQLPGDYQLRNYAPGGDIFRIVDATIASFARHAPKQSRLLFKVHPIDNGLSQWKERIEGASRQHGVPQRVFLADGGSTDALIEVADGIVTVNSTVGLTALGAGRPVIALGSAIYDIDGLTSQGSLADFWRNPPIPDRILFDTFNRALAATTQVRGGFIGREAIRTGAENIAARLMEPEPRLPIGLRKPRGVRDFRYESELFGSAPP